MGADTETAHVNGCEVSLAHPGAPYAICATVSGTDAVTPSAERIEIRTEPVLGETYCGLRNDDVLEAECGTVIANCAVDRDVDAAGLGCTGTSGVTCCICGTELVPPEQAARSETASAAARRD